METVFSNKVVNEMLGGDKERKRVIEWGEEGIWMGGC
jgi:hypothetical protein